MFRKGDIILAIVILVLIGVSFGAVRLMRGSDQSGLKAVIKQGDKVIETIELDKVDGTRRITVGGEYNEVILAEKGRIRFETADCPDRVCVRTGWLRYKGDTAVCIPNKVIIKIEGQTQGIDAVTF